MIPFNIKPMDVVPLFKTKVLSFIHIRIQSFMQVMICPKLKIK